MRRKPRSALLACQALALTTIVVASGTASAQETAGCDQFAWPVVKERQLFADPSLAAVSSGASLAALPSGAIALALLPGDKVAFALAPGKVPKDPASMGGLIIISEKPKPGLYQVTISEPGWIDVIQNGQFVKAAQHSGRKDCTGVHKTVRFELTAEPVTIQFSGVGAASVNVAVLPVP